MIKDRGNQTLNNFGYLPLCREFDQRLAERSELRRRIRAEWRRERDAQTQLNFRN